MRLLVPLSVALILSGCTAAGPSYEFGGSFTDKATQSDMEEFQDRMRELGADDVLILESFPAQFIVRGLDQDCDVARTEAQSFGYVRHVTDCRETTISNDGDEPVSTSSAASGP